jgi:hypothetical protein
LYLNISDGRRDRTRDLSNKRLKACPIDLVVSLQLRYKFTYSIYRIAADLHKTTFTSHRTHHPHLPISWPSDPTHPFLHPQLLRCLVFNLVNDLTIYDKHTEHNLVVSHRHHVRTILLCRLHCALSPYRKSDTQYQWLPDYHQQTERHQTFRTAAILRSTKCWFNKRKVCDHRTLSEQRHCRPTTLTSAKSVMELHSIIFLWRNSVTRARC